MRKLSAPTPDTLAPNENKPTTPQKKGSASSTAGRSGAGQVRKTGRRGYYVVVFRIFILGGGSFTRRERQREDP